MTSIGSPKHPRSGSTLVVDEAWTNTRAWALLAVPIVLVNLVLGAGVAWSTVATAERSITEIGELDAGGRHVLRLVPTASETLPAALCERLRVLNGVHAAYGVGDAAPTRLATGALVTTQQATPGLGDYLDLPPRSRGGSHVLTGATVAARNGFVTGGSLAFDDAAPGALAGKVVTTTRLPQTPRTTALDDSVIIELPTGAPATECRVEPVAGARLDLAAALPAVAAPEVDVRAVPLRPDIELEDEPDRRLAALPGNLLTLGAGAVAGLLLLAWWFIRRAEWALYRTFGMSTVALGALALAEWTIACGAPLVLGGLWGLAATSPGTVDLAYHLAALNLTTTVLITLTAVGAWTAYTRAFSAALALRGL